MQSMIDRFTRIIALLALLTALIDAGRLLGIGSGGASPIAMFSASGFVLLSIFTVARMFAAVGMWIESNWGTAVLFLCTLIELVLFLSGTGHLDIGIIGFGLRLILLVGASLLLWLAFRAWRAAVHD